MKKTTVKTLDSKIREIRKAKGIKQSELAQAVGTSQGRIAEYESGKINIAGIKLESALKIAQALGCSIDEVFVKSEETIESDFRYGIFEASCECRYFDSAWDFVEADTVIGAPLEIFKTEEEALEALKKYSARLEKFRSNGGYDFYFGQVCFVAELEIYDEDGFENDPETYLHGDGIAITEIEKED